jgi:transposase-like protein
MMAETRKINSQEFKQKAVELSNVRGNVQEIACELGGWRSADLSLAERVF